MAQLLFLAAALLNALELADKKIEDVVIVVSGAGAAAVSCTKLYKAFGASAENIIMLDSKGVIRADRSNLTTQKLNLQLIEILMTLKMLCKMLTFLLDYQQLIL